MTSQYPFQPCNSVIASLFENPLAVFLRVNSRCRDSAVGWYASSGICCSWFLNKFPQEQSCTWQVLSLGRLSEENSRFLGHFYCENSFDIMDIPKTFLDFLLRNGISEKVRPYFCILIFQNVTWYRILTSL